MMSCSDAQVQAQVVIPSSDCHESQVIHCSSSQEPKLIAGCNQACMGQDVHPLNHSCKTTNSFVDLVFENFPGIFPVSYSLRSPNSCSGNPVQSHRMLVTLQKSILSH
ncbi:hypothetical protein BDE02_18G012000 [Populus trichocarpa]|nr:hypothetical protein BDE02_18G012000 [Populus trichocarpa]